MKKLFFTVLVVIVSLLIAQAQDSETKENLKNISELVFAHDDSKVHTLGNTSIKAWKFKSGEEVVIAEDGSFAIIMAQDGKLTFHDKGVDGHVDRVIINKSDERAMINSALYIFPSMESLAYDADIVSSMGKLAKKDVTIYELNQEKLAIVSYLTGESGMIESDTKEMLATLQGGYEKVLRQILRQNPLPQ